MKKIFLVFSILLFFFVVPQLAVAAGLVPCGDDATNMCKLADLGVLALGFYRFIVYTIALPLAGLFIVLGGILLLVSAGNPGLAGTAKNMLKFSAIGIVLVFGAYLIIDIVLRTIGFQLPWTRF